MTTSAKQRGNSSTMCISFCSVHHTVLFELKDVLICEMFLACLMPKRIRLCIGLKPYRVFKEFVKSIFFWFRCKQGDLIEFRLKPVYHPEDDFLCHVTPLPNQKVQEFDTTTTH